MVSCISFEAMIAQWYELDNVEDLISRLLKNDNLDIWNTEEDILNIEKEWEDMRGVERTVNVVGEDKNTEKGEKDKGVGQSVANIFLGPNMNTNIFRILILTQIRIRIYLGSYYGPNTNTNIFVTFQWTEYEYFNIFVTNILIF